MNIVLRGTDSHLSDTALRNQLEAVLDPSLRNYCFREKLNKVLVLRDWVLAVCYDSVAAMVHPFFHATSSCALSHASFLNMCRPHVDHTATS